MKNKTKNEVREKFALKFGNFYHSPVPLKKVTGHFGGTTYKLQPVNQDDISDWWLSKIDSLLTQEREEIAKEIEKLEVEAIDIQIYTYISREKVLSIIKERK